MSRFHAAAVALALTACSGAGDGPADAGSQPSCQRPVRSADCSQVTQFQCGFSAFCEAGAIKASWHEHVFCDGREWEEIFDFACETSCPAGCAEGSVQDWPANGAALVAAHCAPADPDGGLGDGGAGGCLFGHDESCNDDPEVSSYEGACRSDGTCACREGFELNPATGRCRWPGDAGACEPPQHPTDCCQVADFQCGFSARCEAGQLVADWHEHVFCGPPPEQIVPFRCTATCQNGCTEGQLSVWPASGQDFCQTQCL
jgi:hypothetical protein